MHTRKLVRDSLGLALSNYLARAVLLVRGVVAAAALGPRGYGSWNALNLILDYGSYATLGALHGLDLELPAAVAGVVGPRDPAPAQRLLAGAWSVVTLGGLLISVVVVGAVVTGRPAIARAVGAWPPLLMLAAALIQLAIQYHGSALRARGEFGTVSRATAVQVMIGGGLGVVLVGRHGIEGLLWGWLAGSALALALLRGRARVPLRPTHRAVGWSLMRAGFPVFAFMTASLVLRSVDRLALIHYGNAAGLGHYSLGLLAAGLVLYLPESTGSVLYPRVAAAARMRGESGSGSAGPPPAGAVPTPWASVLDDVLRAQRVLTVSMPVIVAVGMVWAAPFIGRFLPAFHTAVPALCLLAVGALLLSAATVPGYFLLGSGQAPRLLVFGVAAAAFNAALVFGVAARAPRPTPVALAAAVGYGVFGLGLVLLSTRDLCAGGGERRRFLVASYVPALWGSALALGAAFARVPAVLGAAESWTGALARSALIGIGYLPALWWFGRGVGLKRLAREWLLARRVPA